MPANPNCPYTENVAVERTMLNPYVNLKEAAFWSSGVVNTSPFSINSIYKKKWEIRPEEKIATAGSCFAQHISKYMKSSGFNVMDLEPPPHWNVLHSKSGNVIGTIDEDVAKRFGYLLYSARFGNIYTVHQLLQLFKEALGLCQPQSAVWEKDGRFWDALRPAVEPQGLGSSEEVLFHRQAHLKKVLTMFNTMDVLIFTLGLTEAWIHKQSCTVYPTAPGTLAGTYDPETFIFKNFRFNEILDAFIEFMDLLRANRQNKILPKLLLTVSPVPLTATASGKHVLQATIYSKSLLRAVAGELESRFENIDYFPSYEIVTNPASRGVFYETNLRSVRNEAVAIVMKHFLQQHNHSESSDCSTSVEKLPASLDIEPKCEEVLLDAFGR
jgi:hypothetical protein